MSEEKPGQVPFEVLADAMSENYEGIYDIDLETGAYNVYYESVPYQSLDLARSGEDFFAELENEVARVVDPEDQEFVLLKLSREELAAGVRREKYHSLVYRIVRGGKRVYHQLRATLASVDGRERVLLGVRDVDAVMRQNAAREDALSSERQKAANYLGAVLATAVAYTDANLTEDRIIDQSADRLRNSGVRLGPVPPPEEVSGYSDFQAWLCDNLVCDNCENYRRTSSRESLLECFEQGTGRASVPFSIMTADQGPVPCRAVFYLYRENATSDVHVLCVIYDLTQRQRREKELNELKEALDMCRMRNFTSQMKPHFLYNALGSIQEVMLEDPGRAAGLLEDFTVHLRGCIKAMDGDYPIPFSQELENIRAYTSIEGMRFGDKLSMRYELSETGFSVLPLSIQPLVENAIRHGVHRQGKRGGSVTLRSWSEPDAWVVQVQDDGAGFDVAAYEEAVRSGETDSTGLRNIRFRLEKIMGAQLTVESAPGEGTTATVRIPKGGDAR